MLLRCISAENRKLRNSVLWLVFLIVPLISAVYGTFNYKLNLGILKNGWYDLWTQHTLFYATFFFAPLVAVYGSYLWRLEHLGHNWNLIMTAPVRPFQLYFAKFVSVTKMVLLTQLWALTLFTLCGRLWANLPGWPPLQVIGWLLRGVLGSFGIIALQLLLSMVIRSFALPVLFALFGCIVGLVMNAKGYGLYCPYSLMMMSMNSNKTQDVLSGGMGPFFVSCGAFVLVFFGLVWFVMRKMDVKA